MTEITAYDKNDKVSYHLFTPRTLTDEEVAAELKAWGVNPEKELVILNRE